MMPKVFGFFIFGIWFKLNIYIYMILCDCDFEPIILIHAIDCLTMMLCEDTIIIEYGVEYL